MEVAYWIIDPEVNQHVWCYSKEVREMLYPKLLHYKCPECGAEFYVPTEWQNSCPRCSNGYVNKIVDDKEKT